MKQRIGNVLMVCALAAGMILVAERANSTYMGKNVQAMEFSADAEVLAANSVSAGDVSALTDTVSTGDAADSVSGGDVAASVSDGDAAADVSGNDAPAEAEEAQESEYADLAIAAVHNYVNVRNAPSTDGEIVGRIYSGAVAHVLSLAGEENDWFQITSGNVEGYIKAEYFLYGEPAAALIDNYVTRYATVQASRLNVRKEPGTDSKRIGYADNGEKLKVLENCGEWLKVQYTAQKEGYVSAEYVTVTEEFTYAKTLEEERAEKAAQKELEERQKASEEKAPEIVKEVVLPETTYISNEELRKAIVEYARQFEGNPYVNGGNSLENGTDCSGFTSLIYANFGYSLSRTPSGQYKNSGRAISMEEIQPGDIICYSSNKKSCTHVALYIGDGLIVHAANPRKGIIISGIEFEPIIGVRNVID